MHYFDCESVAREAGITGPQLEALRGLIKQEFPKDQMMYELHLLRACMTIRKGVSSFEEALKPDPAART